MILAFVVSGCATGEKVRPPNPSLADIRMYFSYPFQEPDAKSLGRPGPGIELTIEDDYARVIVLPNGGESYESILQKQELERFLTRWDAINIFEYDEEEIGWIVKSVSDPDTITLPPFDDRTLIIENNQGRRLQIYALEFQIQASEGKRSKDLEELLRLLYHLVGEVTL